MERTKTSRYKSYHVLGDVGLHPDHAPPRTLGPDVQYSKHFVKTIAAGIRGCWEVESGSPAEWAAATLHVELNLRRRSNETEISHGRVSWQTD